MTLHSALAIAVGGALGALARFGIDVALGNLALATAIVNLAGAFLLGLVIGHGMSAAPTWFREGVSIGVFGSFTTMSGVALLATQWMALSYGIYLVLTFSGGILLAWIGWHIGRRWAARSTS